MSPRPPWHRWMWRTFVLAVTVFAMSWQLRLAAADWFFQQDTIDSVHHALQWTPEKVEYLDRLGELDSAHSAEILDRELNVAPRLSRLWIERATRAEFSGDSTAAERLLLHAAEIDRTWLPRWVLTNFYFRQHADANFWIWARRSLEFSHSDLTGLFELCSQMTGDAAIIQRQLAITTPESTRAYVNYLRDRNHVRDAGSAARTLIRIGAAANDRPLLLSLVDQLIDTGEGRGAAELWNDLAAARWISQDRIAPAHPVSNPALAAPFLGRGFDWRVVTDSGITVIAGAAGFGPTVKFSGLQADGSVVLGQAFPAEPGLSYRLAYQASSETAANTAGLYWRVTSRPWSNDDSISIPVSADGQQHDPTFVAPLDSTLAWLRLIYVRPKGAIPLAGEIRLHRVAVDRVATAPRQ